MYTREKELMQRLMKNRNRIKGNVYWEGEWEWNRALVLGKSSFSFFLEQIMWESCRLLFFSSRVG